MELAARNGLAGVYLLWVCVCCPLLLSSVVDVESDHAETNGNGEAGDAGSASWDVKYSIVKSAEDMLLGFHLFLTAELMAGEGGIPRRVSYDVPVVSCHDGDDRACWKFHCDSHSCCAQQMLSDDRVSSLVLPEKRERTFPFFENGRDLHVGSTLSDPTLGLMGGQKITFFTWLVRALVGNIHSDLTFSLIGEHNHAFCTWFVGAQGGSFMRDLSLGRCDELSSHVI